MGLEHATLLCSLKKRFDNCYEEYVKELSVLPARELFELASEIVAIKETYYEIRFWIELSMCDKVWPNAIIKEPVKVRDAKALLSLDNPLKDLGLKWWLYTLGNKVDFHRFYAENKESE